MKRPKSSARMDTDQGAAVTPDARHIGTWVSLQSIVRDQSADGWNLKLKLFELLLAFLVLLGTIYIGFKANHILGAQNKVMVSQWASSEALGRKQNQLVLLTAYLSSAETAGYETEERRRKLQVSLELYSLLLQEDPKYAKFYMSLPALTDEQFADLIKSNPSHKSELQQLFVRHNEVALSGPPSRYRLVQNAPFHIVIGTFRNAGYAREALRTAKDLLETSSFHPFMNIVRNDTGYYLATLSGFSTREEVLNAIREERLQSRFASVYASQSRGWRLVCSANFEPCGPAPPRPANRLRGSPG